MITNFQVLVTASTTSATFDIPKNEQLVALSVIGSVSAATATFQVSFDSGTTWLTVKAMGGASDYSVTLANNAHIPLDPVVLFCGSRDRGQVKCRIVLNTSDTVTFLAHTRVA